LLAFVARGFDYRTVFGEKWQFDSVVSVLCAVFRVFQQYPVTSAVFAFGHGTTKRG
jgi:hypothetical protein